MACLIAPLVEAVGISIADKFLATYEFHSSFLKECQHNISTLKTMLYGGSFLLAVEHIYHGEIIFAPPFLTAVRDGNTMEMVHEIATNGVAMALLVTGVWGLYVAYRYAMNKKTALTATKV